MSDKLLYQIKEDLAVVKVKIESELGEEGRLNVAISDFKRTTDDLRSDVSDIKFDLSPIKTTVTNVLKSFYWALRIVGGALILWMVAHYMELNDLDNVNNKQHMDNMEIPE